MSGSVLEVNTDLFAIFINVAQFDLMTEFVLMIFQLCRMMKANNIACSIFVKRNR